MKKIISAILASTMILALAGCGSSETEETTTNENTTQSTEGQELVIYSNSVSDGRGEWLVERALEDGFNLEFIDAGAGDVQSRLIAEKASPIADITFGLNALIWEDLKTNDILVEYVPVWADEISTGLNDPEGYYHAIVKQAILLAYNSNEMTTEEAPKDWLDLWTNEEYFGRYEAHNSLSGGTVRNVLSGILTRYADPNGDLGISDEGWKQIELYYLNGSISLADTDLYARMADTSDPVVMGQIWSSGIESRDEQYGTKTEYVVPEVGVPYAVEGVAIVNGTEELEEAKRFVDWFGSAEIQGEWAEEFSTLPANEIAVEKANDFNKEIAKVPAQDIDWAFVAANIDAWVEKIELTYKP